MLSNFQGFYSVLETNLLKAFFLNQVFFLRKLMIFCGTAEQKSFVHVHAYAVKKHLLY